MKTKKNVFNTISITTQVYIIYTYYHYIFYIHNTLLFLFVFIQFYLFCGCKLHIIIIYEKTHQVDKNVQTIDKITQNSL